MLLSKGTMRNTLKSQMKHSVLAEFSDKNITMQKKDFNQRPVESYIILVTSRWQEDLFAYWSVMVVMILKHPGVHSLGFYAF